MNTNTAMNSVLLLMLLSSGWVRPYGEMDNHVAKCVHDIAERYFLPGSIVVVTHGVEQCQNQRGSTNPLEVEFIDGDTETCDGVEMWTQIVEGLFMSGKYLIVLLQLQDGEIIKSAQEYDHQGYIMISRHKTLDGVVQGITQQVMKMRKSRDWSPRAKFIVIVSQVEKLLEVISAQYLAGEIFLELWKWQVVDVVVLIKTPEYDSEDTVDTISDTTVPVLNAYTWFPYYPAGHCGDVRDAVLVDHWVLETTGEHFLYNASLYPQKIPKFLYGCPLRVSTFEIGPSMLGQEQNNGTFSYKEGIDYHLLNELAKRVNLTVVFRQPPPNNGLWGHDLGNGTWNGIPQEIMSGSADIGGGGIWYKCDLINELECLTPHIVDTIRWYVPCAKPNPRWTSITRVFKLSLWLGFLIAYIFVAFVMWIVAKTSSKVTPKEAQNEAYTGLVKCFLNFWAIILEESASNDPPEIWSIRSVFLAWVVYCWAVNTVYQTFLTSFLVDPGLQHQLSSEEDLLNSGIEYGVFPGTSAHVRDLLSSRYPRMRNCPAIHPCLNRVAFKGDFAFVFSTLFTEYEISVYFMNADGKNMICYFDELVTTHLTILPVMKGNPLLGRMNKIVRSIVEAGLVKQWFDNIKYISTLLLARTFNLPPGEYIKLTLKHLQSAFYFLLLGYVASVCAFLGERLHRPTQARKEVTNMHKITNK